MYLSFSCFSTLPVSTCPLFCHKELIMTERSTVLSASFIEIVSCLKQFTPKITFCHYLLIPMLMEVQIKCRSPQNRLALLLGTDIVFCAEM